MPRAAVVHTFGAPYVVEEVILDPPQEGEVRVRLEACAICHSDVAYGEGAWGGAVPVVLGHEACGVVAETGPAVPSVGPGDRVIVSLIRHCGECPRCLEGEPALCSASFRLDGESPIRLASGARVAQGLRCGAFAEEVVVHASQAMPIPGEMSAASAALIGCAVLTGTGAVRRTAKLAPGSSVVVIGAGGVGLNAIQGAALAAADPIVAVDIARSKLDAAMLFGATIAVDASTTDVGGVVGELVPGGADTVVVTVGTGTAVSLGLGCLRRGGSLILVGMPGTGDTASIDPTQIAHDGIRILGSKLGSSDPRTDVPELCRLYADGLLKLDELVTATYPLESINDAIHSLRRGDALRNVIVFP